MTQPAEQPYAVATIRTDGSAEISFQGRTQALGAPTVEQARATVVSYLAHRARPLGAPIQVVVDDPEGQLHLVVNPDGTLGTSFASDPVEHDTIPPGERTGADPEAGADPAGAADPAAWGPPTEPEAGGPPPSTPATAPGPLAPGPAVESPAPAPPDDGWAATGTPSGTPQITQATPAGPDQGPPVAPWQQAPAPQPPVDGWQAPPGQAPPMTRRQLRESFLKAEQTEAPAAKGFRGTLARAGIKVQPSAAERSERADIHAVSQHWPGVRTIAIANGKGGANKTPTAALLSATFARYSGAATIAWDNNETRGTLGWRTEQGKHEATVLDLIPRTDELLEPGARAGDISHFVHHQAADKYDVLRSNPNLLSAEQRISAENVDAIHDVLGRYYRLIFVDSGNDESAPHWLRMIDKADQLVVPTIAKPEHAEAGALLLEALTARGGRSAELAQRAVVIVSQAREKDANPSAADIARGFQGWVSDVVTIPYDRAMVESVLRYDALAAVTRRAWLRAAAAVARQL